MTASLEGRGVTVELGGRRVVRGVDLRIVPGRVTAVVGPNGAGKSSLLRALAGEITCSEGEVVLDGRPLHLWPLCDHARKRAVLPQHTAPAFELAVEAVVELGRIPHAGHSSAARDRGVVEAALERVGAGPIRGRAYPSLSGGERQRVHLARVLAQIWEEPETPGRYLLLDEPLSAQDLGRQHQIMSFCRELAAEGVGILVVAHDLNLAARYADDLLLLADGRSLAAGPPATVLTPDNVRRAFGVESFITRDPSSGAPLVIATGSASLAAPSEPIHAPSSLGALQ